MDYMLHVLILVCGRVGTTPAWAYYRLLAEIEVAGLAARDINSRGGDKP